MEDTTSQSDSQPEYDRSQVDSPGDLRGYNCSMLWLQEYMRYDKKGRPCPPHISEVYAQIEAAKLKNPAKVREEAERSGKEPHKVLSDAGAGIALMSLDELLAIEKPRYLIPNFLIDRSLTVLYGPGGTFKSFLMVTAGYAIATGKPFAGRDVAEQGSVVYLAAEGREYLGERLQGLTNIYGERPVHFHTARNYGDTQILKPGNVKKMISTIKALTPTTKLVIIDTFSKTAEGVNEDRATEVGPYMNAAQRIRDETDAAVVIVHHANKAGGFRGSIVFHTHADAMLEIERNGAASPPRLAVVSKKNRGYEPFPDLYLESVEVTVPTADDPRNTTLVFMADSSPNPALTGKRDVLSGQRANVFKALAGFGDSGATAAEVTATSGIPERTVADALRRLIGPYVERVETTDKRKPYRVLGTLAADSVFVPSAPTPPQSAEAA